MLAVLQLPVIGLGVPVTAPGRGVQLLPRCVMRLAEDILPDFFASSGLTELRQQLVLLHWLLVQRGEANDVVPARGSGERDTCCPLCLWPQYPLHRTQHQTPDEFTLVATSVCCSW